MKLASTARPAAHICTRRPPACERGAAEKTAAPAPAPAVSTTPVQSIALLGITNAGRGDTAWLVHLGSREREIAGAGESAFGFTVKAVRAESVVLTRGGVDSVLRWARS